MQRLKRWDFQDELTQMMRPIWSALYATGAAKNDVKISIIQDLGYLARYPEVSELNTGEILQHMSNDMKDQPKNDDPIPLTLIRERPATVNVMQDVGRIVTELGYTHDERLRVMEMFRDLVRYHLKASDQTVRSVRKAILQERDD
jgi:hypothetical protein